MLIGIIGAAGAGKSTVAKHLVTMHGFAETSFAAPLKRLCADQFGWNYTRLNDLDYKEQVDPFIGKTRRSVLQHIGTEGFRAVDPNHWVKQASKDIRDIQRIESAEPGEPLFDGVAVADVRFENEADAIRAGSGFIVLVERSDVRLTVRQRLARRFKRGFGIHPSETLYLTYPTDYIISVPFGVANLHAATDRMVATFKTLQAISNNRRTRQEVADDQG